ncbi:MAG TPA: AI-2E family transporter, partial [Abditibacteriaceae bacterium]
MDSPDSRKSTTENRPKATVPRATVSGLESGWTNRRIFFLLAVGTLIVSAIWHLPQEVHYLSEHAGEIFFTLVLAMAITYVLRPAVDFFQKRLFGRASEHTARTWATLTVFFLGGLGMYLFFAVGLRPVTRDLRSLWDWFAAQGPDERQVLIARWQSSLEAAIAPYRYLLPAGTTLDVEKLVPDTVASVAPRVQAWLSRAFSHVGFLVELLLLPVLVFYFLTDGPAIRREGRLLVPAAYRSRVSRMIGHLDRVLDGFTR